MKLSKQLLEKFDCCVEGHECAVNNNLLGVEWDDATAYLRSIGDTQNYLWMKGVRSSKDYFLLQKPVETISFKYVKADGQYSEEFDSLGGLQSHLNSNKKSFTERAASVSSVYLDENGNGTWKAGIDASANLFAVTDLSSGITSKFDSIEESLLFCEQLLESYFSKIVIVKLCRNSLGEEQWLNVKESIE